ncbi:MAG TPA: hypothetical protein VI981_00265 [Candidatus Paceibacterota bacterium]
MTAEKIIQLIFILAGFCLIFLIVSAFFITAETGSTLETLLLISIIPVIMAGVIFVILARTRYNTVLPPFLRVIGLILFALWIASFFVDSPFR